MSVDKNWIKTVMLMVKKVATEKPGKRKQPSVARVELSAGGCLHGYGRPVWSASDIGKYLGNGKPLVR